MKRLAVLLALLLALLLAVPVYAEEEPLILQRPDDALEALAWAKEQEWEKTYTIGFGNISEANAINMAMGDYIVECCAAYGMEVIRTDNELNGTKAVQNVQTMLTRGIEGLIEFNVDESVGGVVMELCNEAGIPVMAIDIPHPGAVFFGADNALAGTMAGEAVATAAMEKWGKLDCLLLVDQMASGELPRQRILKAEDGVRSIIPDFPADKVYIVEGGTTADVSQAAVSSFLTAHPDECIGIVALQGDNGVGTLAAIQTAGRDEDCVLVVNNEDYFFSHVANYPEETCWYGCVTFQLKDYGQWIAPAMRQILDTGEMPEAVYIEHNVVTRDNIDELFPNWREDLENGLYPN